MNSSLNLKIDEVPKEGLGRSAGPIDIEIKEKGVEVGEMRDKGKKKVGILLDQEKVEGSGSKGVSNKELHGMHGGL